MRGAKMTTKEMGNSFFKMIFSKLKKDMMDFTN